MEGTEKTLQSIKRNEGDILTVGWCALRGGQEDDTFPPLLQVRCLHIGEVVLSLKLLLTKLLQHLVNKEQLLMLEPFNLSYHGHILHGLALKN